MTMSFTHQNHQNVSEATRVWVQASAVEAIRNPKSNKFGIRLQKKPSYNFSDDISESGSSVYTTGPAPGMGRVQQWGWMGGLLISQNSQNVSVKLDEDNSVVQLAANALEDGVVVLGNDYEKDCEGKIIPPNDLITLTHLHEPAVVHCLGHRYDTDIIYTATGPVLIALNPFKPIRGLYGEATMKRYWDKAEKNLRADLPPHVYQIADASFRNMMRQIEASIASDDSSGEVLANQAILVSGESGAGKTVTTKFVMKYLAALSQRAATPALVVRAYKQVEEKRAQELAMQSQPLDYQRSESMNNRDIEFSSSSIESKVLQSNPILESFGNARTIRNDNSSRFGKFIEIQFTTSGKLVGATIETYLLEKVRLVTQSPGERNYHIFYELLEGMDPRELRQYYLAHTATPDDFCMMHSGTIDRRDGVSDAETYADLRKAMETMNFSPVEQQSIFGVTAALLHASNLVFLEKDDETSHLDLTNIHLEPVCQLLGVTPRDLNEALCTFSIQAGRDGHVRRSMDRPKAEKELEALIKATYGAMFQYLVLRINDSIAYQHLEEENHINKPVATIGVLDIFGFESFTVNSFEQLCINYCNEALQQQFNAYVLKNEQEEYEREGIDWSFIEFPENQDVLDLIDKRGSGILNILDDQCRAPGTTDRSFASDIYAKCTGHSRFSANRKQVAVLQFEVKHYAGPVEYTTDGFVEKNRDEMHQESTDLLANSTNPFVAFLAEVLTGEAFLPANNTQSGSELAPYKLRRSESSAMKATVGGQFRRQLRELRAKIDKTSPHYIRCLKPNDHLVPDDFDSLIVAEQLRCGGILEAVRVSRAGFPQHYPHADFYRRYRCTAAKEMKKPANAANSVDQRPSWAPVPQKTWQPPRAGMFRNSYPPPVNASGNDAANSHPQEKINYKEECRELLKVIYRKIHIFEAEENKENDNGRPPETPEKSEPAGKAKSSASFQTSIPPQSWTKAGVQGSFSPSPGGPAAPNTVPVKARYQPWAKQESPAPTPPAKAYGGGFRRATGLSDLAKVGIQLGKTKVFLRHKAFETLERIRSRDLNRAATALNNLFRMYLCRLAYIPFRDAYRAELRARGLLSVNKETKEDFSDPYDEGSRPKTVKRNSSSASHLIAVFESEVRASIHNPTPRSEWGKDCSKKQFKWVLVDGIWVKNQHLVV